MGKIVGNYELLEQLGQGETGVVYKARYLHFDKIYAIKRLWEHFSSNRYFVQKLNKEMKKLTSLHHENIVEVREIFEEEGEYYIVMEFIEGEPLTEIFRGGVPLIKQKRKIEFIKQLMEGVKYIHSQDDALIHRDIKPHNILVSNDGILKISDFGIVRELKDEVTNIISRKVPSSFSFIFRRRMDTSSIIADVYSLGLIFYEILGAESPFSGKENTTPPASNSSAIGWYIPAPEHFDQMFTTPLRNFVMKAINKRFATIREMLQELIGLEINGEATNVNKNPIEAKYQSLICRDMVFVEGGSIKIGPTLQWDGNSMDEIPVREVKISDFYISKYEITQELWMSEMSRIPSNSRGKKLPVDNISLYDAIIFCNHISRREGLIPVYRSGAGIISCDFHANGYRLPTDLEWTYAASGGNKSKGYEYSGSNNIDEVAWYRENSSGQIHDVGTKQANELGLYDMSGNVDEWCWNEYENTKVRVRRNQYTSSEGCFGLLLGGSCGGLQEDCCLTYRECHPASRRSNCWGARLVRTSI